MPDSAERRLELVLSRIIALVDRGVIGDPVVA